MSDTIELSELLASSKDALESKASFFYECDQYDQEQRCCDYAVALRAIAPALVELVSSMCAFNAEMGIAEVQRASTRRDKAQESIHRALTEAGVTCE